MKQTVYFIFLSFAFFSLCGCGDGIKHYDVIIEEAIEREHPQMEEGESYLIDLSTTFGVEWDTMFFITSEVPKQLIKIAVGEDFERGYNRLFLKKASQIVFHDSIPYFDSSAWFDISGQSVWFSSVPQNKTEETHYYQTITTKQFEVKKSTSGYYTLYPHYNKE